jgi:IclR family acetate operon transcriptional repressor
MSNSELSHKLSIPKSTASYILRTLEQRGYLHRERASGRYRLGLKVLGLGRGVMVGADLKQLARPTLNELAERTGLTVHLAVPDHGEAVYIDKVESAGFLKTDTWVGERMPLHATSVGKAIAAHFSVAELEAAIRKHGLKQRTPKTITTHALLLAETEKIRARGYAVDDEENNLGARCLGAPILDGFGRVLGAVGVSGSTGQIGRSSVRGLAEHVMAAARQIAAQLGRHSGYDRS